jgi:hypothetical protein
MTVSLDGFLEDRDGSQRRLYTDLQDIRDSDFLQGWIAETGAVLMGRRTFAGGAAPASSRTAIRQWSWRR